MAALLLAPTGSLASHRALAFVLGVGGFDVAPSPEISIPRGTSFRRPDVVVHESTDLALAAPRCVDGLPCTGVARLAARLARPLLRSGGRRRIRPRAAGARRDPRRVPVPVPVPQHWVRICGASYRLDFAYPDRRVCVEVDGIQHRDDPDIRAGDVARQRALEAAGWTVIRIRSWCFATDLADALRQLRGHLVGR